MLSRMVASSPSRGMLLPARAFSTSLALGAPRDSSPSTPRRDTVVPKVRSNPLVGNYIPPQPVQLKPNQVPPVSTEHPRSSKPPQSSAEVPPNVDMPPPPPPPPAAASEQTPPQSKSASTPYLYDATELSTPATPSGGYKPVDIAGIIGTAANKYTNSVKSIDPTTQHTIRAAPVVGRTVFIKPRMSGNSAPTPTTAFRQLQRIVANEKVRNKWHTQKFHERKGLKRKRLSSERWRARFKAGFKATVSRVLELKKQGW